MKKRNGKIFSVINWVLLFSLPVILLTVNVKTHTINSDADTKTLATSFISKVDENITTPEVEEEKVEEKKEEDVKPVQKVATTVKTETEYEDMKEKMAESVKSPEQPVAPPSENAPDALETYYGNMSGYGPWIDDNNIWHLYRTATGWDLRSKENGGNGIYDYDSKYGTVRIVASNNSQIPKYSILRCTLSNGSVMNVIVRDNGDKNIGIGEGRKFVLDLAYNSASEAWNVGVLTNVKFELLRKGR